MKATFYTGLRYRTKFRLPRLISSRVVLAALKDDIEQVALTGPVWGVLTIEARWKGKPRVIDSELIIESISI